MIVVVFNKPDFEYDVHSLLKEFFPQEDVQMYYSCSPDEVEGKNLACTHHEMTDDGVKEFADASQLFKIDYVGDEIAVEWTVRWRICSRRSFSRIIRAYWASFCFRARLVFWYRVLLLRLWGPSTCSSL